MWARPSFLGVLLLVPTFTVTASAAPPQATQPGTLKDAIHGRFLIGDAVDVRLFDNPEKTALLVEQFDCLTGEGAFKPRPLEPTPGQFTFEQADRILAFAQAHRMTMIGHTLCWHQTSPNWMYEQLPGKPLSREKALANLKRHIDGVLAHFHGKIRGWDVVNEAISERRSEFIRDNPARRAIGEDFVEKAFEYAQAADPDVEKYYNDYNIERPDKREKALRLMADLRAKGLRVDAIGIQGHWGLIEPSIAMIEDAIVAFHAAGLKVSITELDIDVLPRANRNGGADLNDTEKNAADPYREGCPPDVLQKQAQRYHDLFALFAKHADAIERVTFWGLSDGDSWLNNFPAKGRTNYPLLWDRQLKPKPAFWAVLDALAQ